MGTIIGYAGPRLRGSFTKAAVIAANCIGLSLVPLVLVWTYGCLNAGAAIFLDHDPSRTMQLIEYSEVPEVLFIGLCVLGIVMGLPGLRASNNLLRRWAIIGIAMNCAGSASSLYVFGLYLYQRGPQ